MNKAELSVPKFVLGLFFLLFGTYAYTIGGDIFKYISIFTGVILLLISVNFFKLIKLNLILIFKSSIYFALLIIISFLNKQETTDLVTLTFDFLCFLIFLTGFFITRNSIRVNEISRLTKLILSCFIFFGFFKLYSLQVQGINAIDTTSRHIEDSSLNSNGIAYMSSQFVIFFLWLFLNEKNTLTRFFIFASIVLVSVNLFMTESRGATIFVISTILFCYGRKIWKKITFKNVIYVFVISLVLFFSFSENKVLNEKLELNIDRYNKVLEYRNGYDIDGSLYERKIKQKVFFEQYEEMYLGQLQYKPYPHNQYLEIFMRWGVFGLPLFFISIIAITRMFFLTYMNKINKTHINFLVAILFIFTYLQSMSSMTLDNNRFLWLGFGFILGYFDNEKKKN